MDTTMLGDNGGRLLIAILGVGAGLLILVAILWWMKNRPASTFIRGGRNRQPRLAVLDAAAVDTRRRLVLVRRDDVEHLILIGGPTDVVIESRILAAAGKPDAQPDLQPRPAAQPLDARLDDRAADRRVATPAERAATAAPLAAARPAPVARTPDPTISNAGASLYGEQAVAATQRREAEPSAAPVERRPAAAPATEAQARAAARPEDILEAARLRVMPQSAQPVAEPRPAAQAARTPAQAQPQTQTQAGSDFERLLDAEISGNLQTIGTEPRPPALRAQTVSVQPDSGTNARTPHNTAQPGGGRREPSLEEEMFRLLEERDNRRDR
ncbi:Flagellar biosynthesis protein, FliO [Rhizobium sp. RU20A]|uniref:flagellar biosynthetic protein FliO n=1 Tax=Rhizobium sp. RU20A TaxID=1907412 RepID=UPI000955B5E6|nr:flagellar biosynthetic protein FliO [Rhizobium sp. RU20A]SIQ13207.1 Flagellar biosynthesis protein, FliO [Rhizobium sp. RU20A]